MSWVANMMISVALPDRALLPALTDWLEFEAPWNAHSGRVELKGVGTLTDQTSPGTSGWGGSKFPECTVWAGVLNHADLPAILAKVESMPWEAPGAVQVLLLDQEETYFRLWMIREGQMTQFAPAPPPEHDESQPWVG